MRQIKRVGKGILKVHCVHLVVLIYHTHTQLAAGVSQLIQLTRFSNIALSPSEDSDPTVAATADKGERPRLAAACSCC
jgi:hypothetical protein